MKTLEIPSVYNHVTSELKPLVDQLVRTSLPTAVRNKSLIINDIPAGFDFTADTSLVAQTLEGIFTTFLTYTGDSCIRISAERIYGSMVQINVTDNNNNHSYAVACALQKIVPIAEKTGGHLNITNRRQKITTISFIFPVMNQEDASLINLRGAA